MKKTTNLLGGVILGLAATVSVPAAAANDTMKDLIRIMHENGQITDQQFQILLNGAKADEEQTAATIKKIAQEETKDTLKITTKEKIQIASADGNFEWDLFGRVMVDATFFDDDQLQQDNGTETRRLRFGMGGTLWKVWNFKLQPDFANNSVSMKDAWVGYKGFKNTQLKFGNHHVPFGLELIHSSKYMTFIERSPVESIFMSSKGGGDRRMGASVFTHGSNWTAHVGYYGDTVSTGAGNDNESVLAGRVTFAPLAEKNRAIHLGLGVSYLDFDGLFDSGDNGIGTLKSEARPGTHIGQKWIKGSISDAQNVTYVGLEAAGVFGPFAFQGEYIHSNVDTASGADYDQDGYYVQASYFLTGESRAYKPGKGTYSKTSPKAAVGKGGYGAWQIATRFASVDLSDQGAGEMDLLTLGLNWYATKNVRFMLDYNKVLDITNGNVADGDEAGSIVLRSQVFW